MIDADFWRGRSVLVTGHTGFKGSWLALWLHRLGARVTGCALKPDTDDSLFEAARLGELVGHRVQDIRDREGLLALVKDVRPEIVFHLAAQSLVRYSYRHPVETYETNVLGTAHLLESLRDVASVSACVVVTTDKCYENLEQDKPYREDDALGGHDPYSSSKACAEILTASWRRSFFGSGCAVATARAGNVLGGGDRAEDRLVPDFIRALEQGKVLKVRNPHAVRPWQHVLEPLAGYMLLAQRLVVDGDAFAGPWNFGPDPESILPVSGLVDELVAHWGKGAAWDRDDSEQPHEARLLSLDSTRARERLGWRPRLDIGQMAAFVTAWYRSALEGADPRELCLGQIARYEAVA